MSFLDQLAATLAPTPSREDRMEARRKARLLAKPGDWLDQIIDHHEQIDAAFDRSFAAPDADGKRRAARELGELLTGHSIAEEVVVYPDVVEDSKTHGAMAYQEQQMAKINFAKLEKLDPMSQDWRDKLEHIQSAVQLHVYQEEDSWFPDIARKATAADQARLTQRYSEEAGRYFG